MPKLKTKKTLTKRVKITKGGKIIKKQSRTGHLKSKWSSSKNSRKSRSSVQENRGHILIIKRMLGKLGKNIK